MSRVEGGYEVITAFDPQCFALNFLTFALFPQSRISHQRRLWFLLKSTNSQPQLSPWH
jgi:hypothetical protein